MNGTTLSDSAKSKALLLTRFQISDVVEISVIAAVEVFFFGFDLPAWIKNSYGFCLFCFLPGPAWCDCGVVRLQRTAGCAMKRRLCSRGREKNIAKNKQIGFLKK